MNLMEQTDALLGAFDKALTKAKRKRNHRTDAILIVKARFGDEAIALLRKMQDRSLAEIDAELKMFP